MVIAVVAAIRLGTVTGWLSRSVKWLSVIVLATRACLMRHGNAGAAMFRILHRWLRCGAKPNCGDARTAVRVRMGLATAMHPVGVSGLLATEN